MVRVECFTKILKKALRHYRLLENNLAVLLQASVT